MNPTWKRVELADDDPIVTQPLPNTEYHRAGMRFRTDGAGRTVEVIVPHLEYHEGQRRQLPARPTGSEPSTIDSDGESVVTEHYSYAESLQHTYYSDGSEVVQVQNGHIVAHHLGGPPDAFNLVPQTPQSNQSGYKADIETPVDSAIDAYPETELLARYQISYDGDGDAAHPNVPRVFQVELFHADDDWETAEPIESHRHLHYSDPDLDDVADDDVIW